jgi:lysophospholipase L1-like esterase
VTNYRREGQEGQEGREGPEHPARPECPDRWGWRYPDHSLIPGIHRLRCGLAAAALLALAAAACDDSPTRPTGTLTISCPASQTVQSLDGNPVAVTFAAPVVTGGTPPVTTTCTRQSGSRFDVGSTDVACTARDAAQHTASCSFRVTVVAPPKLSATKFLAFGDSMTEGEIPTTCSLGAPPVSRCAMAASLTLSEWLLDTRQLRAEAIVSSASYPSKLAALLASRYSSQSMVVVNAGKGGEMAVDGADRLPGVLTMQAPEVLLLLEGINDIHKPGRSQAASIGPLVQALRTMIHDARSRGARVFVSTLLPEDKCGCRAFDFVDGRDDIVAANAQIRVMAASEGVVLVDLYPGFAGQTTALLSFDGLHPNEAGYAKMAEMFFEAIRQQLESGTKQGSGSPNQ